MMLLVNESWVFFEKIYLDLYNYLFAKSKSGKLVISVIISASFFCCTKEPLSSIPPLFGQFDINYKNQKIQIGTWIGTISGLVVFNNASGIFDDDVIDARPIIFEEDGIAKKL